MDQILEGFYYAIADGLPLLKKYIMVRTLILLVF